MSSYLGGGLASLDRWEGLKEWHRRHQDLLGERSTSADLEGCSNQSQPSTSINRGNLLKNTPQIPEKSEMVHVFPLATEKHDLSIIPEAEEDSRSREGDFNAMNAKYEMQKKCIVPKKTGQVFKLGENLNLPTNVIRDNSDSTQSSKQQNPLSEDGKVVKRPFLRKGQGLVKYNLKPDDVKRPYQKVKPGTVPLLKHCPKPKNSAVKFQLAEKAAVQDTERYEQNPGKLSKTKSLALPMQRLVLSVPQKSHAVEIGTWSQVFNNDPNPPSMFAAPNTGSNVSQTQQFFGDVPKASSCQTESRKLVGALSPARKKVSRTNTDVSPEEDQESLAAYLDLEQHVSNASFCSTSSKVDRLVTKSSKPTIHQSNPDAITQSKQLTPVKTGRKFLTTGRDKNETADHLGMWSQIDLENLIKARARRSGSLIKPYPETNRNNVEIASNEVVVSGSEALLSTMQPGSKKSVESVEAHIGTQQDVQDIDLMLEAFGPVRKPHLMKTMSSIDLDSSLVKNALAATNSLEESESETESESSSSESSSEELEEDITSQVSVCSTIKPPSKPPQVLQASKELDTVPRVPCKLVSDATLEEINYQIESHLTDLRKEIESLQSAKKKTQKYVSSLEKKVHELEHRLILDARSFNSRLEDEREAAAKRLSDEQGKFLKEKQALQRTLREERRKAPDPVTQQEYLRLKQEVAQWEEKWRAERAKARGLESNLRIQLTNLKRENEKLREENSKLRREKETALNTARAKASSNTRVINSIAQNLGNKPKVTIVREEDPKLKKLGVDSAYNLKAAMEGKISNPMATIENFPKLPYTEKSDWSTDEEIDLGKESSDEDDINNNEEIEMITKKLDPPVTSANILETGGNGRLKSVVPQQEPINIQETEAKYDAIFGKSSTQPPTSEETNGLENIASSQGNLRSSGNNGETEKFVKAIHHSDGKVEQVKENGTRVITYPDGTWRRHSSSGSIMTVPPSGWPVQISYFNGDQLEKLSDGTTRYFYAKTNIWQTTYPDGHEEMRYPSGQVEHREPNGSVKVALPGSTFKSNGTSSEPGFSPNGVSVEKLPNGDTIILLPNGESELHSKDYMKKEFLDGTVRFLYKDGSQETRYPSGRIRIKDPQGNLVKDTNLNLT